jgi:hypothetical protein
MPSRRAGFAGRAAGAWWNLVVWKCGGGETNTEGTERTENLPTLSTGRQAWRPAHDQSPAVGYFENLKKNK